MRTTPRSNNLSALNQSTLQPYLVPVFAFIAWLVLGTSSAHAQDDWSVRNRDRRHQLVLQRFIKIVEANPTRGFAYKRMVKMARRSPGLDKLLTRYKNKVRRAPSRINFRLIYAHLLYTTRNRTQALAQYQEVIKRSPQMRLGHLYIAQLYQTLQQPQKALLAYQSTLKYSKTKAQKRYCLKAMGTLSFLLKQPKQALGYWKQYLAISPGNTRAREELALALARQSLHKQALKQWNIVLKRSRGSAKRSRVLRQMGQLHEQWGKWKIAVKHYRKAMGYTQRGHWLRRELNERILQLHRENGQLAQLAVYLKKQKRKGRSELAMLARLLDELGRDKQAAVMYEKALRANPNDTKLRQKYITLLEVLNRTKVAIKQYRILIKRDPTEPRHRLSFAEMLSRVGKRKESLAEMDKLARVFSRNTEILSRLANLYRRRRMNKEAIALYKRLIRIEPREPAHRRALGDYYYRMNEYKKALEIWNGILRSGMVRHKAQTALGQILRDHDMLTQAQPWFAKALKAKPKSYPYLMQLGELYQRILDEDGELPTKWLASAIEIWKKLHKKAKIRSRRKRALQQLFALYHAQGTLYRKPPAYLSRINQNPRDIEALRWMGEYKLWQAQKRGKGRQSYYSAQQYFKRILNVKSKDLDSLLTLEHLSSRKRNWTLARRYLLRAVKANPRGRRGYYRRICNYSLKMNAFKDAIKYGRKALSLNPDDASAHADLARIYRRAKQINKAVAAYREAIRLRPHSYSYYLALAKLLIQQEKSRKAVELYRHVAKNAKDGRMIYESAIQAIQILHQLNQTKTFEGELQTLADAHPRELAYFRALAELYRLQGRMKEYRVAYLKAAATVDQKSQVYKRLAEVAQEQGDLGKAIIYFRKMLEESPNPSTKNQIKLASFYLQVNDNRNARKILLSLLNEHPNSLRVLRQVAQLFYQHNMLPEATKAYELFLDLEHQSTFVRRRLAELYQRQQQFEAAAGILSELVWNQLDKPIVAKRKKKTKPGRKKKKAKKLPYYLRKRRYSRYKYYRNRQKFRARNAAMGALINLHERMRTLDLWDRRVLHALSNPQLPNRMYITQWLVRHYEQRQWYSRLENILLTMHKQAPSDSTWISHLAAQYKRQNRFGDALALYIQLERLKPRTRQHHYVPKITLLVAMKDHRRLGFLLQEFLSSHMALNYYRFRKVLGILERNNQYKHMERILKWALRNGSQRYKRNYLEKLTLVYLKLGKQKQARVLLWQAWRKQPYISRYSNIKVLMKQRQTLIAQLWPLLAENQRKWLVKHTEQQLIDVLINADPKNSRFARLKKHNPTLKIAIVNLHALLKVSQGEELAQQYLPAIWGITGTSYYGRRMRREIMRGLLQQGKYQLATALIGKGLSTAKNDMAKLQYIQLQLTTISQSGLLPPRSFSRFLERQLRQLRPNVSATLWKQAALTLADRYLTWGNYQRAIWWIEVCRWSGGRAVRNDDRFLLRLARAWRRKGNEKLAKRFYGKVVQKAWTRFSKHAHDAFRQRILHAFFKSFIGRSYYSSYHRRYWQLYQIIQKHKGSWNQLVRKYRYSRYRYMMYRLIQHISWKSRRYKTQLKRSTFAIQTLYTLHHEAERKNELFSRLHKAWKSQTKPTSKQKYLFHLLAAYRLDWSKHRTPSSLQAMLTILRRLHRKSRPKPSTQIIALLGQIEAEAGHYKSAIKMYRTQLASIPPNKRNERIQLLRQIAQVYGQAGNQKAQRKAYLRLSTQYRDGIADKWLATHYLEMGRTNEAIRFYRQFQQRGIRTFKRRRSYVRGANTNNSQKQLALAQFLIRGGHADKALFFLTRCIGTLRLRTRRNYYYRSTLQRAMLLLLHIGKLQELVKKWELRRKNQSRDIHLLSMLYVGYQTLDQPKRVRNTMAQMLAIRPYDNYLLQSLLNKYKYAQLHKEGLAFLKKLYETRNPKPDKYYLWLGRFSYASGSKKEAFKAWQQQFKECKKQTNVYRQFQCRYNVGQDILKANGIKQALNVFVQTLKEARGYYASFSWTVQRAANALMEKKAHRETILLLNTALRRQRSYQSQLSSYTVRYYGLLIRAHKQLKQTKQTERYLRLLEAGPFSYRNAAQSAARILEQNGRYLAAETSYWRAIQQTKYKPYRQTAYNLLCAYWYRRGLHQLCDGEELRISQRLEQRQRNILIDQLTQKGFAFEALLELRKLRLNQPRDPKILQKLFPLSLQTGRLDEAALILRLLRKNRKARSSVAALQKQLAQAKQAPKPTQTRSQFAWNPVAIPAWCSILKIQNKRLKKLSCKLSKRRCKRRLLRVGQTLLTNDCQGHLIAIDANTGHFSWIHTLPKRKEKVILRAKHAYRFAKPTLYRFYEVLALRKAGSHVLVAVNENWLESGYGWGSGMHTNLHLLMLHPKTGAVKWKRSLPGDFVRGTLRIHRQSLSYMGRKFQVLDLATGQTKWSHAPHIHYAAWLFADKTPLPHVTTNNGYVIATKNRSIQALSYDGKPQWNRRFKWPVLSLGASDNKLFVLTNNEQMTALDASSGKKTWVIQLPGGTIRRNHNWKGFEHEYTTRSPLLVTHDKLVYSSADGYIRAFRTSNGSLLWKVKTGEQSAHPPALDKDKQAVVYAGQSGTVSIYSLTDGSLTWRYTMPAQTRSPLSQVEDSHTSPDLSKSHIWMGAYDAVGRFSIYAFTRKVEQINRRANRLFALARSLQKARKTLLSRHLIQRAISPKHRVFRKTFLTLARDKRLPLRQRLRWVYAYLNHSQNLRQAIKSLPKALRSRTFVLSPISTYATSRLGAGDGKREQGIAKLLLMLSHPRRNNRRMALRRFRTFCLSYKQRWLRSLFSPLSRRFASLMIQSTSMEERFLGAFALSFWGDNEGRKTLLKLLVKTQKRSVSHIKRLRLESMRLLFKWDKRINWKGMALPQDLPLFLPLLRDNHREIRLRIALYLGHLGSIHKSHRRHLTPKVRTFLARSVNFPTKQLAILAAITLADLGQRNGVLYLRQLYGQFGASKRHRIARILQNNYQDYWGKRAVLAMYKGRYASNLVLPSFRIIYASLLYNYQQYNDALFHFQRTFKLARKSVTPQHKAMALFGMSRCFYKLKRYKLSIQKLKQAKQIDPFIRGFASTLGQNHYRLGQYKQAKTQLANAWRMTGGTPHILRYMTLLSLQQNKTREAARRLQKTLSNTPEQTHEGYLYQYVRAWIEARPNSTKTALKIVNKLLNMREKHPLYLRLKATILHRQKRFKAAQKTFNEAIIQTAPDSHHRPIYIKQFKALYKRTPKLHTPKP